MALTHGLYRDYKVEYQCWKNMLSRCYDTSGKSYKHYGAKGITVCVRWRNSLKAFIEDMGCRPHGGTIHRINGNLGYTPRNCKWASRKEQATNNAGVFKSGIRANPDGEFKTGNIPPFVKYGVSDETRKKMSISAVKRGSSKEWRTAQSARMSGRKASAETKRKMAASAILGWRKRKGVSLS